MCVTRISPHQREGLIFPKRDGRPWSKSDRGNWRRRWLRRAAEGVAPGLTPRDLRHTCASLLAATNTPRIEIENQLGHRADTSERIFQHLIDELRGTELSVDALIAQARVEVFREGRRREFGGQHG